MQYFDTLPKIIYTDQYGIKTIRTNLLARASVIPELLKNPLIYYQYDVQEGDTPEIVAHKYYNDMYRYWLVLFANQILDPQWGWPLNSQQFQAYLTDKYGTQDIYGTIDHYEKTITTIDINTQTTTINTVEMSQNDFNSFVASSQTLNLATGPVDVSISAAAISIYDNEVALNEAKRTINILNNQYVDEVEQEFAKLMSK